MRSYFGVGIVLLAGLSQCVRGAVGGEIKILFAYGSEKQKWIEKATAEFHKDPSSLLRGEQIQVKLKADPLSNDLSVPRISHSWDALISFVTGALYKTLGNTGKHQAEEGIAMQHVQAAVNVEKNQSEFRQQVVPVIYESQSYMDGGQVGSANPFSF